MATITMNEILILGMREEHTYTHYQASFSSDFSELILDVETNKDLHKYSFHIFDKDGKHYIGNKPVYTRYRIKYGDTYGDWIELSATKRSYDLQKKYMENLLRLTTVRPYVTNFGINSTALSGFEDDKDIKVEITGLNNYDSARIEKRKFKLNKLIYGKKVYISDDEYDLDIKNETTFDEYNNVDHNSLDIDDDDKEIDTFCGFIEGECIEDNISYLRAYIHTDDDYETGLNKNDNGYLLPSKGGSKEEKIIPDSDGKFNIMFHGFNGGDILIKAFDSNDNELLPIWYEDKVFDDVYTNIRSTLYVVTDTEYKISEVNTIDVNYPYVYFKNRDEDIKFVETEDVSDEDDKILLSRISTKNQGAIRSYIVPEDDDAYDTLHDRVFSYDQAMYLLALKAYGFHEYKNDAIKATNWLISTQLDDGSFRFSTNTTGEGDKYIRNGNVCWILFALAHIYDSEIKNDIDGLKDSIEKCLEFLRSEIVTEDGYQKGSIRGGHGKYNSDDTFDEDYDVPWCATEHNLDYYQALKLLKRLGFNVNSEFNSVRDNLIKNHFNYDYKTFRQGIASSTEYDNARALDVYSWGIFFLRDVSSLREYINNSINNIENKYNVTDDDINGYKPYSKDDGYSEAEDVVWCEGSMGVATAYGMIGDFDKFYKILNKFKDRFNGNYIPYVTRDVDAYEMSSFLCAISLSWSVVAYNFEKIFDYNYSNLTDTAIQKYINNLTPEDKIKLREEVNKFDVI